MQLITWIIENKLLILFIVAIILPPYLVVISATKSMRSNGLSEPEITLNMSSIVMLFPVWFFFIFLISMLVIIW